jgi:N4-bis(aminopropyl)spermidine synthase
MAMNAISDVVQNRPWPLRDFDQIYMKSGDMVMQTEFVANWADGRDVAFIGDGDAISISIAYFKHREITDYGPRSVTVFDFDERIVRAIKSFAEKDDIKTLDAELYNVLDAFPHPNRFQCFYTNPPWGQYNNGESVNVFAQRGMEAVGYGGDGMIVIADDKELDWPKQVLSKVQCFTADNKYYVSRMMPRLHLYHLEEAPELQSCNLIVSPVPGAARTVDSQPITEADRLNNFYGRSKAPREAGRGLFPKIGLRSIVRCGFAVVMRGRDRPHHRQTPAAG